MIGVGRAVRYQFRPIVCMSHELKYMCRPGLTLLAMIAASVLPTMAANAADASGWEGTQPSAVRLIAGAMRGEQAKPLLRAGVQIRLAPGWKTYWRYPGDAGVPPLFDFSGSENVKSLTMLWPAPQRFKEDGLTLIAYKDTVIFPLHIEPEKVDQPVIVRLQLDYGICERVCIPMQAKLELGVTGGPTAHDSAIASAEAKVPKQLALREGQGLSIRAVRREGGTGSTTLVVDVAAPERDSVDLFAEGPTSEWSLPLLELSAAAPGMRQFKFRFDPPDAEPKGGWQIKFTGVTAGEAIEVSTTVTVN